MNRLLSNIFISLLLLSLTMSCKSSIQPPEQKIEPLPALHGKMVFHRYTSYDTGDSEILLYDFTTNSLQTISSSWNISNPMNAHFSPDGRRIVFMGVSAAGNWSIYSYDLTARQEPVSLIPGNARNEDPKFSPDGLKIIFKQNMRIAELVLATGQVTLLSERDYSMPYYSHDATKAVCSKGAGAGSSIAVIDVAARTVKSLYDRPGVQEYYPVTADDESFYYSAGFSENRRADQIYRGYWSGVPSVRMPFNGEDGDYSDAYPVNSEWVLLSSTRTGTRGGYDLYVAHTETGDIWPATAYNDDINTVRNELGACIYVDEQGMER